MVSGSLFTAEVERAGGTVEVKTGVGQGTEIVVDMPV